MYRRKCEWLKFSNPWILMVGGLITFGVSAAIAAQWLPKPCALICLFNMVAVVAYSTKLSSHWKTKNITMAAVCATPVVIGWQAGQINHPIVPWALGIAALAHLSREIVKDIQDILANEGKRVTLPMVLGDRVEGPKRAAQLAGGLLAPAVVFPLYMMRFTHTAFQESLIALAVAVLVATAGWLIFRKEPGKSKTAITAALLFTIVAFL
jgi:4-hydroxybenzoate polyprenyltransferase